MTWTTRAAAPASGPQRRPRETPPRGVGHPSPGASSAYTRSPAIRKIQRTSVGARVTVASSPHHTPQNAPAAAAMRKSPPPSPSALPNVHSAGCCDVSPQSPKSIPAAGSAGVSGPASSDGYLSGRDGQHIRASPATRPAACGAAAAGLADSMPEVPFDLSRLPAACSISPAGGSTHAGDSSSRAGGDVELNAASGTLAAGSPHSCGGQQPDFERNDVESPAQGSPIQHSASSTRDSQAGGSVLSDEAHDVEEDGWSDSEYGDARSEQDRLCFEAAGDPDAAECSDSGDDTGSEASSSLDDDDDSVAEDAASTHDSAGVRWCTCGGDACSVVCAVVRMRAGSDMLAVTGMLCVHKVVVRWCCTCRGKPAQADASEPLHEESGAASGAWDPRVGAAGGRQSGGHRAGVQAQQRGV
jgi:hypothetical protein